MPLKPLLAAVEAMPPVRGWVRMAFGGTPNPPLENMPKLEDALIGDDIPGGVSPGGGPVAVEKLWLMPNPLPMPGILLWGVMGVGGMLLLLFCPFRTPKGFFEKLSLIPPLTLL